MLVSCTVPGPSMLTVLWDPSRPVPPVDLVLQGSMRVPLGAVGVLLLGMNRLEPNWWVHSGAGECKGSRPALPVHYTTVVLHRRYPAVVHMLSIGVYIYLDGDHWVWGYHHTIGAVYLYKVCTSARHRIPAIP